MTTNKVIAEKINIFLNLLFHLEDYISNQKIREEQLHISKNIKDILAEISDSHILKDYFFHGADMNNNEDNDIVPEFKPMRLTENKIKYIKKVNPQSFNQKNLDLLNFFYNSSGETDMINDLIKNKVLSIIKYCLTQVMLKKYKEKEKKIQSKINFVLISKDNNKLLKKLKHNKSNLFDNYNNKLSLNNKNRSLVDLREQFRLKPNFIIPPINIGIIKNKNNKNDKYYKLLKKEETNNINKNIEDYYKTNFSKNYKFSNQDSKNKDKNNEKYPKINKDKKSNNKGNTQISSSSQMELIHLLHKRKLNDIENNSKQSNKEVIDNIDNNPINLINENNKLLEKKFKNMRSRSDGKSFNKNIDKRIGDKTNYNKFEYNKLFNMYNLLKKRGYMY